MCWNEQVSWITFILGTVLCIATALYIKNRAVTAVCLVWFWVLLMQFFEALMWRDKSCGQLNKFATNGAYVANIMQPVAIFLICIAIMPDIKPTPKMIAALLIAMYLCFMFYKAFRMRAPACTASCVEYGDCKHLHYSWWDGGGAGGWFYTLIVIAMILLLLKPFKFALFQAGFVLLTLLVATRFFGKSSASMWCWMAAFAPLFVALFWKLSNKK